MQDPSVARRYGKALFMAATEKGLLATVKADLEKIVSAASQQADLFSRLENPALSKAVKKFLLADLVGKELHPLTQQFLGLLIEKRRIPWLREIAQVFQAEEDKQIGRVRASVVSAAPLTNEAAERIRQSMAAHLQKEVILTCQVDPKLLAGFNVQVGGRMMKSSARGRLTQLKDALEGSETIGY